MIYCQWILFLFLLSMLSIVFCQRINKRSPFYQQLPECDKQVLPNITKHTNMTGIVCPMVKDEEVFLSEWVAYYELHGFSHIIIYDDNSTQSFAELKPWIDSGFVSIKREWWKSMQFQLHVDEAKFYNSTKPTDMLNTLSTIDCKKSALLMGIDLHVAVDIDEYIIPNSPFNTVMDELTHWITAMQKTLIYLHKYNFSPASHFHEPINLLTIEAYQSRHPYPSRLTYYTGAMAKVAILLRSPLYPDHSRITEALVYCCNIHGCPLDAIPEFTINEFNCSEPEHLTNHYEYVWKKSGKYRDSNLNWINPPMINHYSRSLDKFALKQDSWNNLAVDANGSLGNSQGLSTLNFLNRAYGWYYDDSALSWSCLLRSQLRRRTGEENYLRPGDFWIRNAEFGKPVSDPRKRGRNGNGYGKVVPKREWSPYPPGNTYQSAHYNYKLKQPQKKRSKHFNSPPLIS